MLCQELGLHPRVRRNIWKIFGRAFLTLCSINIFLTTVTQIWSLNEKVMNLKNYWHYLGLESLSILASGFRFSASHTSVHFFLDPSCFSSSCFCILPSSPQPIYQLSPVPPSKCKFAFTHCLPGIVAASVTSHPKPMSKFEHDVDWIHFVL